MVYERKIITYIFCGIEMKFVSNNIYNTIYKTKPQNTWNTTPNVKKLNKKYTTPHYSLCSSDFCQPLFECTVVSTTKYVLSLP